WVVERCLAKTVEGRYASTLDLAREIQNLRDRLAEVSSWDAPGSLAAPRSDRLKKFWIVAAAGAGVVVLAVLIGVFQLQKGRSTVPVFHQLTFGNGHVTGARFSADGQSVIYGAAWGGQEDHVYTTQPGNPESGLLGLSNAGIWSVSSYGAMAIACARTLTWAERIASVPP